MKSESWLFIFKALEGFAHFWKDNRKDLVIHLWAVKRLFVWGSVHTRQWLCDHQTERSPNKKMFEWLEVV